MPTCSSVPTIAWYAPPSGSRAPMLFIEVRKKFPSSRSTPLLSSVQTTDASGRTARTNAEWMSALQVRLRAERRPSTAFAAAKRPTR